MSGHGEAQGAPDIARITLGVEARAQHAAEATEQANQQMAAVVAAVHQSGVAAADVRTQNFSINFEQQPEPYPPVPGPERAEKAEAGKGAPAESPRGFYRVSNTVLMTVRDLGKLGAVLGAATRAGANNVWGIEFEIEDPSQLEAAARREAVAEARARAEQLAALAGVKLGRLVSLAELGAGTPMARGGLGFDMKAAQSDVPVQGGQLTVSQDVQLVFSIE